MQITAFLPCRRGSERVPCKNTRPIAHYPGGLIDLKLRQLSESVVNTIVVSTDDILVAECASEYPKASVHWRDLALCRSDTSTDELITHAADLITDGAILWTHATSPFIEAADYNRIVDYYEHMPAPYDSLMTVTEIRKYLWRDGRPLNYERGPEKWPRTQTIDPVYEINSGVFLAPAWAYRSDNYGDRIGIRPMLYTLTGHKGLDIDYPDDFDIAAALL